MEYVENSQTFVKTFLLQTFHIYKVHQVCIYIRFIAHYVDVG